VYVQIWMLGKYSVSSKLNGFDGEGRERSCFRVGAQETCTIYQLGIGDVLEEGLV